MKQILALTCLLFVSSCCAGGYSGSSRRTPPPKTDQGGYEWELNVNTSELEYCTKRGIARYCL